MPIASLDAFEARLAAAAHRFAGRLAGPAPAARELEATLLRLGFAPEETRRAVAAPRTLAPARLAAMREALARELSHLARRARAGRADYDLNRHIAVFRAERALAAAPPRAQSSRAGARRAESARRSASTAHCVAASIRR